MKKTVHISYLIVFVLMILGYAGCLNRCEAQVLTVNDDFDGQPQMGFPPTGWNNCNDGYSTVDTQPGIFGNYAPASQGSTYISIVTRGINPAGTVETVWADLLKPFEIGQCYSFNIDISLSHDFYATFGWNDYYFDNPSVLQVIGFNGDCNAPQDSELLWQSGLLSNYSWQTFNIILSPVKASYEKIAFRPFFSPPSNFLNSAVFLDKIRMVELHENFIHQDGILMLPSGSSGITWYFNNNIIADANTLIMPDLGTGLYRATFYDKTGCLKVASENFTSDKNYLHFYPNPAAFSLTFEGFLSLKSNCRISIYNEIGQIIIRKDLMLLNGPVSTSLDISSLAPAAYLFCMEGENLKKKNYKLIVIR